MAEVHGRVVSFGPFRLNASARRIERDGQPVALGSRALDILLVLVERAGEVVSARELTERVWRGLVVEPNGLRVHIAALRKALDDRGADGRNRYVANVPGQGYSLIAPVTVETPKDRPHASSESTVLGTRPTPRHDFPHEVTSFVGREAEMERLCVRIKDARLLTLTGMGGCGKTRLALQVGRAVTDAFPDGSRFVELASLNDPGLVDAAVAAVLEVKEAGRRPPMDSIVDRLGELRMLLVLDNAEHLLASVAVLVDTLMRRCGALHVLVTSREPLRVAGEEIFKVPPLSVPPAGASSSRSVLACESARLFIERAKLHRPEFEPAAQDARPLASVCRRLDGIALAIELAAPRLRAMTVRELDGYLEDRLGLLTGGHRTALPRHRTLRSLLDWSHELLEPDEQAMLRASAVFSGGVTVDAAERVCGDVDALALLTSLADKNLMTVEFSDAATRFSMLDTVRDYAAEKLGESGDEAQLRRRHFEFFMSLAEALAAPHQDEKQIQAKLKRLDLELGNIREALAWCAARPERAADGLRLAGKLAWFWMVRGHAEQGREWNERFLKAAPDAPEIDRAKSLATAGLMSYYQDDYVDTASHYEEALAIYRRLGIRDQIASMIINLGALEVNRAHYDRGRELFEEALMVERELGDMRSVALLLFNLGVLECAVGDFERARLHLEEGVRVGRAAGPWSASHALQQLGWVHHVQGRSDLARGLLDEALKMQREFGDPIDISTTQYYSALVSIDSGELAAAQESLREALTLQHAIGDRILAAGTLEAFAALMSAQSRPRDAAYLWGASEQIREDIGAPMEPAMRERNAVRIDEARASSEDLVAFDKAWRDARTWGFAAAVQFALNKSVEG